MDYEKKLVTDLTSNEQFIQIISADDLVKEYQKIKNLTKSYTVAALDGILATKIFLELGYKPGKVIIKEYSDGKKYVILKGYAGTREIFRGTRYLINNPTIIRMAIGPKGIISSAKQGTLVGFVLSVGLEVFEYLINDEATISSLLGTVSTDIIKIGLSAIAGAAMGLAVGSFAILGTVGAAPLIAAIIVGVVTGKVLDKIDSKYGVTKAIIQAYKEIGINLNEIEYKFNRNLNWLNSNPEMIKCLFSPCSGTRYGGGGRY